MMLRFHEYSRPKPVQRAGSVEDGRRLSLSGELHTLGYYSTVVCLGNPGRPYDLIVDTGSSITAVPCAGCRQCGTHLCGPNGRFSQDASPTSQPVVCPLKSPITGLSCETCRNRRCEYSVRYTEGSSIRGHILNDFAHFKRDSDGADASEKASARVYFGCQTQETGMFNKQQADGIIGLQASHTRSKVRRPPRPLPRRARTAHLARTGMACPRRHRRPRGRDPRPHRACLRPCVQEKEAVIILIQNMMLDRGLDPAE